MTDERNDIDAVKRSLDSDPLTPGPQIESVYEEHPTRAERNRADDWVLGLGIVVAICVGLVALAFCSRMGA